jgi:DNA-directed RNA polymerase sigma subunit (sigma70/sigma32)
MRYGLNGVGQHSLSEIAHMYIVTPERIRQIQVRAERKLKNRSILVDIAA